MDSTPATQHASPTHKALADLADLINALPDEKTVVVTRVSQTSSAAQLRAVLANQSHYQGGQ